MTKQVQTFIDDELKEEIDEIKEELDLTWETYFKKSNELIKDEVLG